MGRSQGPSGHPRGRGRYGAGVPEPADRPSETTPRHWFEPLAEFLGPAYLRNAFTKGTEQEVAFLWEALDLRRGSTVLDVGCGPGRHALALARRGAIVTGVDISEEFVALARQAADAEGLAVTFVHADARSLTNDDEFDAAICLCQGAFGLPEHAGDDSEVVAGMVRALRPGGRLALSAFSAYFAVRFLEPDRGERFDADAGVNHEVARLKNEAGEERTFDLGTSCWTPRELRLLAGAVGLEGVAVHGVTPGRYGANPPDIEQPEFLLLGAKPRVGQ